MNSLAFTSSEFGELRTINKDNEPLFCAKDVAAALGYANPNEAIRRYTRGERNAHPLQTAGGIQDVQFIREGDVYRLIAHSKLPNAEKFESWVFDEVLPQIRKTGGYIPATDDMSEAEIMARALQISQHTIEEHNVEIGRLQGKVEGLEKANNILAPKADFYDKVMELDGLLCVRKAAKVLKSFDKSMGEKLLRSKLRERGIIEKNTLSATAYGIERGYVRERIWADEEHSGRVKTYACLTPKGLGWCREQFCKVPEQVSLNV